MKAELLGWKTTDPLREDNLVRVHSLGDGNCFFHSIISAFYIPYRERRIGGKKLDRKKFVIWLRRQLADRLTEKDENGIMIYDTLSRGTLRDHSKELRQLSLEYMINELASNAAVDNIYVEFVSNEFNKDIYIIDERTRDVYITGMDFDILYKKRDSIVLLYSHNHYDLLARISADNKKHYDTLFDYKDPLIKRIRRRIRNSTKKWSTKTDSWRSLGLSKCRGPIDHCPY